MFFRLELDRANRAELLDENAVLVMACLPRGFAQQRGHSVDTRPIRCGWCRLDANLADEENFAGAWTRKRLRVGGAREQDLLSKLCHADDDGLWRRRPGASMGKKSLQPGSHHRTALSRNAPGKARNP